MLPSHAKGWAVHWLASPSPAAVSGLLWRAAPLPNTQTAWPDPGSLTRTKADADESQAPPEPDFEPPLLSMAAPLDAAASHHSRDVKRGQDVSGRSLEPPSPRGVRASWLEAGARSRAGCAPGCDVQGQHPWRFTIVSSCRRGMAKVRQDGWQSWRGRQAARASGAQRLRRDWPRDGGRGKAPYPLGLGACAFELCGKRVARQHCVGGAG